ncbi:uncharacterized protein LOC120336509 isoform X3 [Styela clava]
MTVSRTKRMKNTINLCVFILISFQLFLAVHSFRRFSQELDGSESDTYQPGSAEILLFEDESDFVTEN